MSNVLQDLRLARRLLVKNPLFTAVVVATLAIGIGLNTAVFSAVDALLLRPLPGVRSPGEVVQLYRSYRGDMKYGSNSIPHYLDVRQRSAAVFSGVATWNFVPLNLSTAGRPQRVMGMLVSANYFSLLGVSAMRGRTFLAEEDSGRGAHPVAIVSYAAWKGLFGGDTAIVGRSVVLNGQRYSIVGVAPKDFSGIIPVVTPALWVPLMQLARIHPASAGSFDARGNNSFNVIGRLKPGVSVAAANQRMTALVAELRTEHPADYKESGITLVPQSEAGVHPMFKSAEVGLSSVVMAVVGILLLIACVNVANLFLARARDRAREMAIRLSLGARRSALVRQLLTESLVFAAVSGLSGLAVAWWAIRLANRITLPFDVDFNAGLRLSPTVLIFTLAISVVTGLLFGVAPALQATRPSLVPALKGEAPAGESRSRVRGGLVVAQMALSIVLLVSAGLFLRNLKAATSIDKGFISDHLLNAEVDPGMQGYDRARTEDFYRRLTERLRAIPTVRAVGLAEMVPLGLSESDNSVEIPGYVAAPNENMSVQVNTVSPGYFEAMGIPLLQGRGFSTRDDSAGLHVMVVNQHFVDHFWHGLNPIGRIVHTRGSDHTVIGVVPTGKYFRLGEDPATFMYLAQAQHWSSGMTIHIRTTGDPTALMPTLRAEVAALDADLPLGNVRTMENHLGIALLPARLTGAVLGIFGMLGLVLASLGIYGVMAYTVSQRTREIGIRMAIGAAGGDVVRLVMRQGLALVVAGTVIGFLGALGAARLIRGVLYGGGGFDAVTFAAVPLVLITVASMAIWIPAHRASGMDPVLALRQE
ncbi:MAG TPA: ABC transporter permease [Gemmatimonadaceae bacterium]|nr:ABC transporter permease [Gemmatimonadaceae bacterium]